MTDGFSGVESALSLPHSKAQYVSHSNSYGFRVATPLCGKGGVLGIPKTYPSWIYLLAGTQVGGRNELHQE